MKGPADAIRALAERRARLHPPAERSSEVRVIHAGMKVGD
jgi:hypothetical protein